jgi:multidrug efflux pump
MIPSEPFIKRPVATTLLTLGILLMGFLAFRLLPVAPLPQVDFPTISVSARMPGGSPETIAATLAMPLERTLGRIAGVTEMTSSSSQGQTRITLQFDLDRDIDGAARDVQAAINASYSSLPSGMPSNPTYRKVNPADSPIMIIGLTSKSMTRGQMYDVADSILAQKLLQTKGIGDVSIGGGAQPAVRVELNPTQLSHYGIDSEAVRSAITNTNANKAKGFVEEGVQYWQIHANDQVRKAEDYQSLVIATQDNTVVRISDVARVEDSVLDVRTAGMLNGEPAVLLILYRQPNANIIETVDRVRAMIPRLQADIPQAIDMRVVMDRTPTIRASLAEVERSLLISIGLVVLVVFVFLRNVRATLVSAISVPVSLVGTFSIMYLLGFSLNNLSLMALTIATGFVVDDTIVVLENIARHLEKGETALRAALLGAKEVGFTVVSMSVSLVAVFIPILLMGGILGRLFREFAISLSVAIGMSLLVSLTTTPMLCAKWLKPHREEQHGRLFLWSERCFTALTGAYRRTLEWSMRHGPFMMLTLGLTIVLNVYLYISIPKGFFPQQDTGRIMGNMRADQSISFQAMQQKLQRFIRIVAKDPAVSAVSGFTGGGQRNGAFFFISLKPLAERQESAEQVIVRLRNVLSKEPGANLFLQAAQDIRIGGRSSNAQFQYTLLGDSLEELNAWSPKITEVLSKLPELSDVNSDQQTQGLQTTLTFDRDAMAKLGITQASVNAVLYDAFGQRQVSTIYNALNQYRVVMEVAPEFWQSPDALHNIYMQSANSGPVPLASFAQVSQTKMPMSVSHQGQFTATTISFNLPEGVPLSKASKAIEEAIQDMALPSSIHGSFQGGAKTFQDSLRNQPLLILAAIVAVYIVLGMLYESLIHPVTILSTLPSAGVGALLALRAFDTEFSVIALIGVLLLIGIVKKNAIMMVDFALSAQREQKLPPHQAIVEACVLRFRPILMTTLAALFGALPLMIGHGEGSELRQPLGIAIVGGLVFSQLLTLYTTPLVYLYLDRLRVWHKGQS